MHKGRSLSMTSAKLANKTMLHLHPIKVEGEREKSPESLQSSVAINPWNKPLRALTRTLAIYILTRCSRRLKFSLAQGAIVLQRLGAVP